MWTQPYRRLTLAICILLMWNALNQPLISDDGNEPSYILLANGNVLHGVARPYGEKIELRLGGGNLVHLDSKQVVHIAPSRRALYDMQVRSVRYWGSGEHWNIAHWCIQQKMLDEAIFHYRELVKLAEPTTKLKQLEHELKSAILESENVKKLLATQGVQSPNTQEDQKSSKDSPVTGIADSAVRFASATKSTESNVSEGSHMMSIPGYVTKVFHTNIAPILVNRCGQSGCHGFPGKSDFHIYAAAGENAASIGAKNLEQILKYVDPKKPHESKLIAYATKPHGIHRAPSFNAVRDDDRAHIERIAQWIKSIEFSTSVNSIEVAAGMTAPRSEVVTAVAATESQPVPIEPQKTRKDKIKDWQNNLPPQDKDAKLSKPPKSGPGILLTSGEISDLENAIEKLEKQTSRKQGKDPFDPSVFNAKYGKKTP